MPPVPGAQEALPAVRQGHRQGGLSNSCTAAQLLQHLLILTGAVQPKGGGTVQGLLPVLLGLAAIGGLFYAGLKLA